MIIKSCRESVNLKEVFYSNFKLLRCHLFFKPTGALSVKLHLSTGERLYIPKILADRVKKYNRTDFW